MSFLPDWAPNIHPLIVHFPIAILLVAVFADFLALVFRRVGWLRFAAVSLYVIGATAAIAAFFTGRQAADTVKLATDVIPIISEHADWALRTVWFYSILAVAQVIVIRWDRFGRLAFQIVLFIAGFAGLFLLYETGDHGAQMVFGHGVGVTAAASYSHHEGEASAEHGHEEGEEHDHGDETAVDRTEESLAQGFSATANGGWTWLITSGADDVLRDRATWLIGTMAELSPSVVRDEAKGDALSLRAAGSTALFTLGEKLGNVQGDVLLNKDSFTGRILLVHHVRDAQNYGFLSVEDGFVRLGQVSGGKRKVEDEKAISPHGWFALRLITRGEHFRGYVNGELACHGHASELPAGPLGLLIEGTGTILVKSMDVMPIE